MYICYTTGNTEAINTYNIYKFKLNRILGKPLRNMPTNPRISMYKPNGRNHVRTDFKMSYKHVHVRGLSHFYVHTTSLCVGRPSRRVGFPSVLVVSVQTPSPSIAIATDRLHSSAPVSERP